MQLHREVGPESAARRRFGASGVSTRAARPGALSERWPGRLLSGHRPRGPFHGA